MNNIILLGGTFNPVHKGHIRLAESAHDMYHLPVIMMPSGDPSSYKSDAELVSAKHRVRMLEIATSDYPYISVSTMEVDRPGRTFTADTLAMLKDMYDNIYFIIGADSFFAFPTWYKPDYISAHCNLLVAGRNNRSEDEMLEQKNVLEKMFDAKIHFLNLPDMPFSSTQIRNAVKCSADISGMVPEGVAEYITFHKLYGEHNG